MYDVGIPTRVGLPRTYKITRVSSGTDLIVDNSKSKTP